MLPCPPVALTPWLKELQGPVVYWHAMCDTLGLYCHCMVLASQLGYYHSLKERCACPRRLPALAGAGCCAGLPTVAMHVHMVEPGSSCCCKSILQASMTTKGHYR